MAADLTEDHLVQCTNTLDLQSQVGLSATKIGGTALQCYYKKCLVCLFISIIMQTKMRYA